MLYFNFLCILEGFQGFLKDIFNFFLFQDFSRPRNILFHLPGFQGAWEPCNNCFQTDDELMADKLNCYLLSSSDKLVSIKMVKLCRQV